jgi:hypothetical protein
MAALQQTKTPNQGTTNLSDTQSPDTPALHCIIWWLLLAAVGP